MHQVQLDAYLQKHTRFKFAYRTLSFFITQKTFLVLCILIIYLVASIPSVTIKQCKNCKGKSGKQEVCPEFSFILNANKQLLLKDQSFMIWLSATENGHLEILAQEPLRLELRISSLHQRLFSLVSSSLALNISLTIYTYFNGTWSSLMDFFHP